MVSLDLDAESDDNEQPAGDFMNPHGHNLVHHLCDLDHHLLVTEDVEETQKLPGVMQEVELKDEGPQVNDRLLRVVGKLQDVGRVSKVAELT